MGGGSWAVAVVSSVTDGTTMISTRTLHAEEQDTPLRAT